MNSQTIDASLVRMTVVLMKIYFDVFVSCWCAIAKRESLDGTFVCFEIKSTKVERFIVLFIDSLKFCLLD